jgi:hypothetical protein
VWDDASFLIQRLYIYREACAHCSQPIMILKREKKKKISIKKPKWEIHAYFLDACNCDWGCPCQFNAKPTQHHTKNASLNIKGYY